MSPAKPIRPIATTRTDLPIPDSTVGRIWQLYYHLRALMGGDPRPVSNPVKALLAPPPTRQHPQTHDVSSGSLVAAETPFASGKRNPTTAAGAPPTGRTAATPTPSAPAVNAPAAPAPVREATPDPREVRIAALSRDLAYARAMFDRREKELLELCSQMRLERERLQLIADAATTKTAQVLRELELARSGSDPQDESRRGRLPDA